MALQYSLPFQCKAEIRCDICACHSPPLRAGGRVFSVAVNFSSRWWKRSVVTCSFLFLFRISFTSLGYRRSGSGFCSAWWVEQRNWGRLQCCYRHQLDSFQWQYRNTPFPFLSCPLIIVQFIYSTIIYNREYVTLLTTVEPLLLRSCL